MAQYKCTFCGTLMEEGTGAMLVKRDGSIAYYCSSKCKNNVKLGRVARRVEWTEEYHKLNRH
ncbi:MAG: 50S ribosomal protein L24e [Methanosarcinales archaeon]|nr:50S ribosomal protein L24e [Methanosarcinales archaeon]